MQPSDEFVILIGYEGYYEINRNGKIRSVNKNIIRKSKNGITHLIERFTKTITPKKRGDYLGIQLFKDGVKEHKSIHRLVAINFIPNPNSFPLVNHKNGDKYDNRVNNLEWCTHEYNQTYSRGIPITLINSGGEKVTRKSIRCFCREFQLNRGSLKRLQEGKQKQTKGWVLP